MLPPCNPTTLHNDAFPVNPLAQPKNTDASPVFAMQATMHCPKTPKTAMHRPCKKCIVWKCIVKNEIFTATAARKDRHKTRVYRHKSTHFDGKRCIFLFSVAVVADLIATKQG